MAEIDDLIQQVYDASVPNYMTSKGEVWDYFLERNNGDRTKAASEAGRALSGESSGSTYKNARRNFEARGEKPIAGLKGSTPKWHAFGMTLPPVSYSPPENGYEVTFAGSILINGEYCEYRSFTRTITGEAAEQLARDPGWSPIFDTYFEMQLADELCGPATVDVRAA